MIFENAEKYPVMAKMSQFILESEVFCEGCNQSYAEAEKEAKRFITASHITLEEFDSEDNHSALDIMNFKFDNDTSGKQAFTHYVRMRNFNNALWQVLSKKKPVFKNIKSLDRNHSPDRDAFVYTNSVGDKISYRPVNG